MTQDPRYNIPKEENTLTLEPASPAVSSTFSSTFSSTSSDTSSDTSSGTGFAHNIPEEENTLTLEPVSPTPQEIQAQRKIDDYFNSQREGQCNAKNSYSPTASDRVNYLRVSRPWSLAELEDISSTKSSWVEIEGPDGNRIKDKRVIGPDGKWPSLIIDGQIKNQETNWKWVPLEFSPVLKKSPWPGKGGTPQEPFLKRMLRTCMMSEAFSLGKYANVSRISGL